MTPADSEAVVMVNGGGAFTVRVSAWVAVFPAASAILIVMFATVWPVGVPATVTELELLALNDRPAGSVPEVRLQVNGLVPPVALMVALYAVPAVAAAKEVVEIAGSGFTVICTLVDLVGSLTEVAVTVAVITVAVFKGATYVALVGVTLVRVPPPETVQVTPPLLESLATPAVTLTVCA
jgi:hypothetical protein